MASDRNKNVIQIFPDGSYWGDRGGYGAVIVMNRRFKKFSSPYYWVDTNITRMETRAIISALRKIKPGRHKIDIYCDNETCVKIFNDIVRYGTVKHLKYNKDLWSQVLQQITRHKDKKTIFRCSWIRSHSGNRFNEMADDLARKSRGSWDPKVCKKRG